MLDANLSNPDGIQAVWCAGPEPGHGKSSSDRVTADTKRYARKLRNSGANMTCAGDFVEKLTENAERKPGCFYQEEVVIPSRTPEEKDSAKKAAAEKKSASLLNGTTSFHSWIFQSDGVQVHEFCDSGNGIFF
jgi:hypothetical protein